MIAASQYAYTQLKRAQTPVIVCISGTLLLVLFNSLIGIGNTHPKTSIYYAVYLVTCMVTIASHRQSLLHPACLLIYTSLLGFGLNIPLFCLNYFPGVHYDDAVMSGVCIILLTSTGAALIGTLLLPRFAQSPKFLKLHLPHPSASTGKYFLFLMAIFACGLIRITFHLGEPGKQPNLPFSGVLQFIFYEGAIVMSLWYLSRALQVGLMHIILAMSLLAAVALIQSLLGWRGGVFSMLMVGIGIFILQDANLKSRSPLWLGILGICAIFLINLGNEIRSEKLGGNSEFAKTEEGYITRVLYRAQGTSRLAEIVQYFGEVSLTNNMMYQELADKNLSATVFIDREVYGVDKGQSHSVGTSGPGGPYVNMGLIGVFLAYLGLGMFFKLVFNLMWVTHANNPTIKIIYCYIILIAVQTQSENFGLLAIKAMFAISVLAFSFNYVLQALFSPETNHATPQESAAKPQKAPYLFHT